MVEGLKENNLNTEVARHLLWKRYLFYDELNEPSIKHKNGLYHLLTIKLKIRATDYDQEVNQTKDYMYDIEVQ
ncbi:12613_t:CDS:2 [Funneliformis geosporum]|uniref:12613_t:CDS:1 n=1 Tax=Funneliformis geosporum TaxID=1117311 RepID=A0A9W4WTV6_9GLOM|nr:12613_t:CDS:2 [Funneliformis geosporum]